MIAIKPLLSTIIYDTDIDQYKSVSSNIIVSIIVEESLHSSTNTIRSSISKGIRKYINEQSKYNNNR